MAAIPNFMFDINNEMRARAGIRREQGGAVQSLNRSIPDGDTTSINLLGSASIRFLGIDTPEKAMNFGNETGRPSLASPRWETYLTDPFAPAFGAFDISAELKAHLQTRIGPGAGVNHRVHGDHAEKALIALIESDMQALGQDVNSFEYFLSFSHGLLDQYGRFLAFVNRNQSSATPSLPRPLSYNERMLQVGAAMPFFMWPNIDPFRQSKSIVKAVIPPGTANTMAQGTASLRRARDFVKQARANAAAKTVFEAGNPLRFEAFEVRYLSRRKAPDRAVIDLSKNDDVLLQPQHYFHIPNPEDRLFIPPEYVPLFASRGWKLEGWE
jgi:hypothetical protein